MSQSMHDFHDSQTGFTLVELMVALVLSLFLMGGAILMYISVQSTYDDTTRLSRMQENVRFASDYLVRDIRNAGFRDELSLTIGEETLIREEFVTLSAGGDQLTIRYAGRGHCQEEFDGYRIVENTYLVMDNELRCAGRVITSDGDVVGEGSIALVGGVEALGFELWMADGDTRVSTAATTCNDDASLPLNQRCLAVRMGLEFEGLREPGSPGTAENRFVELFATFRNAAIGHIYANLYDDNDDDDDD